MRRGRRCEHGPPMLSGTEIVEAFFEAIYRLDFDAAVEFLTDDASYHDLPLPTDPTVGKDAIRRKLEFMIAGGVTSMDYEIRHMLGGDRSEEHTSELQSLRHLVCRLLLEKKK